MTARGYSRPAADATPPSKGDGGVGTALLDAASREDGQPHINLIICDSQPLFAQELVRLLASEAPDFEVSGIAASVQDLLAMTRRLRPDLVLLDARFGIERVQPLFSMSWSV